MHLLFAALLALTQPWLLVSDLHVNPYDGSTAPAPYKSDTNWTLFDRSVAAMRRADPGAPVVVIAGDFLAHQWPTKAHDAGADATRAAEQTMARIAKTFGAAFPRAQFLIALGNNDDPCGDYRTGPDSAYLAAVAKIWAPLVNRGGVAPRFLRDFSYAGYYTASLPGNARAIVLDDVYWSMFFRACAKGAGVGTQELLWLEKQLRAGNRAPIVLMHIPPGVDPTATLITHRFLVVPYWMQYDREQAVALLARAHTPLVIAGHTHRLDFRLFGGVPYLIAPSISPIYANNPAFLTLDVQSGGTLRDYQVYEFDYDSATFARAFDFDTAYQVHAFSSAALAALHRRIGSDPATRQRWANAVVTGASDEAYGIRAAWRAYWCAQTEAGVSYTACAGDSRRAAVLPLAAAAALAVVVGAVVWYSRKRLWKRRNKNV